MVRSILFATDGSESAVAAARLLGSLPLPAGTRIRVICVVDVFVERVLEPVQPGQRDRARELLEASASLLRRDGVEVDCQLRAGDADHQILLAARELPADLVVLGSKGLTGLEGFVLGSVARNVAQHAPCSVLIARPPAHELRDVLVATDGSEHGTRAVEFAAELPLPPRTRVTAVSVVRHPHPLLDLIAIDNQPLFDRLRKAEHEWSERAEELLLDARARLERGGKAAAMALRAGDPAREILALAREREADLIVAGARGRSLIEGLVLGSVADRLLRQTPGSVLLVR